MVEDTLRSNTYGGGACFFDLVIDGDITNNGVIQDYDPGHWFRIYVNGNIHNNGVWANYATIFTGDLNQTMDQASGTNYACDFESQKGLGDLIALNDIAISGDMNLNSSKLRMNGHVLNLRGWIYNGFLDDVIMHGGYMQNLSVSGNLVINGTVSLDDNVYLVCNVKVNDTLQCNTYGGGTKFYDVYVEGSLSNYGVIQNYGSGLLQLFIAGNLLNGGNWINYLTYVYVAGDQYIDIVDNKFINGSVQFEAMAGPGPYQWLFNDAPLDSPDFNGETSQVLTWLVPVSDTWYGIFRCNNGSKTAAGITVRQNSTGIDQNQTCNAEIWSYNKWLIIDLKENSPAEVMVYDLSGRMIASCNINNGLTTITVNEPGVYLVRLQSGKKRACKKVVIR